MTASLSRVPRAVLAARLRTLTEEGFLGKRRYEESPPRDEYVVTDRAFALWPTLRTLGHRGREHHAETVPRIVLHAVRHRTRLLRRMPPPARWSYRSRTC